MSYDEHLISMAGGDGEPEPLDLDAIQARYPQREVYETELIAMGLTARTDVPALLAYARDLEARIRRVEALASAWEARGESDMAFSKDIIDENISIAILTDGAGMVENARHIRAALTATEGQA